MGRISDILIRIGKEVEDEGPLPEMRRLGEKLEELRGQAEGAVSTWPDSKEAEVAQTETANTLFQKSVLIDIDAGIPADVIESFLLYFWFRCTTTRPWSRSCWPAIMPGGGAGQIQALTPVHQS